LKEVIKKGTSKAAQLPSRRDASDAEARIRSSLNQFSRRHSPLPWDKPVREGGKLEGENGETKGLTQILGCLASAGRGGGWGLPDHRKAVKKRVRSTTNKGKVKLGRWRYVVRQGRKADSLYSGAWGETRNFPRITRSSLLMQRRIN